MREHYMVRGQEDARLRQGTQMMCHLRVTVAALCIVIAASGCATEAKKSPEGARYDDIVCRSITLTDRDGNATASLRSSDKNASELTLLDRRGVSRIRLSVADDGVAAISVIDEMKNVRVSLSTVSGSSPFVSINDEKGNSRILLETTGDGGPQVKLMDRHGKLRVVLECRSHPEEGPDALSRPDSERIVLFDPDGNLLLDLPAKK